MPNHNDGAPLREKIMIYDLVALADCSDMRRSNLIRRARAWLAAESGGLEKADLGQLLRADNLPIWQLPPDQAAALLDRIEAGS